MTTAGLAVVCWLIAATALALLLGAAVRIADEREQPNGRWFR